MKASLKLKNKTWIDHFHVFILKKYKKNRLEYKVCK